MTARGFPSVAEQKRAVAHMAATGDLTAIADVAQRAGLLVIAAALRGRKLHRGRGRSEEFQRNVEFLVAFRRAARPRMSKAERFALIVQLAAQYRIGCRKPNDEPNIDLAVEIASGKRSRVLKAANLILQADKFCTAKSCGGVRHSRKRVVKGQ
jgi:hypothetical protein